MDPEEIILAILEIRAEETDEDGDLSPEGEQAVEELEALLDIPPVAAAGKPSTIQANAGPGSITLQAVAADPTALRRFKMIAYTGGSIRLANFIHPVVIDLERLDISKDRYPALRNHDNARIIGHTDSVQKMPDWTLRAEGVISGVGPDVDEVLLTAGNNFPWQASPGVDFDRTNPAELEFVPSGQTAKANGRMFAGPIFIVRKGVQREFSFCPNGADGNTSVALAAQRGANMTWESWLIDLGWTVEDITGLSDEVKTFAQQVFEAINAPEDPDPNAPPILPAATPVPAVVAAVPALPVTAPIVGATPVPDLQAHLQTMRTETANELARQAAITRLCPDPAFHAEIDQAGKLVAKYAVLPHAIQAGWSAQETELVVLRASRATGIPSPPNGNPPSPLDAQWEAVIKSRQRVDNAAVVRQRLGLLPAAGLR